MAKRLRDPIADHRIIGDRTRYISVSNAGGLACQLGITDRRPEQPVRQPESLEYPTTPRLTRQQLDFSLEPLRPGAQSIDVGRHPCRSMGQLPDRHIQDFAPWRLVSNGRDILQRPIG